MPAPTLRSGDIVIRFDASSLPLTEQAEALRAGGRLGRLRKLWRASRPPGVSTETLWERARALEDVQANAVPTSVVELWPKEAAVLVNDVTLGQCACAALLVKVGARSPLLDAG